MRSCDRGRPRPLGLALPASAIAGRHQARLAAQGIGEFSAETRGYPDPMDVRGLTDPALFWDLAPEQPVDLPDTVVIPRIMERGALADYR